MSTVAIIISKWYDEVSPESASQGEYHSTGNDYTSRTFNASAIDDAVETFVSLLNGNHWESNDRYVNEAFCAVDPDTDYETGHEYYDRISISVVSDDTIKSPEVKALISMLNDRIESALLK